jgi:biotin carboxyl carrier protein
MLNIQVNSQNLQFDLHKGHVLLDGKPVNADIVKLDTNKYHMILENQSLNIELLDKEENGKTMNILINGKKHAVQIKDQYDALLSQLGLDKMMVAKANNVKAPMPGLVLRIQTKVGDTIKKGDALLVLEAMKMENVIKADGDGKVKKICVEPKQAVEKNTILIELE